LLGEAVRVISMPAAAFAGLALADQPQAVRVGIEGITVILHSRAKADEADAIKTVIELPGLSPGLRNACRGPLGPKLAVDQAVQKLLRRPLAAAGIPVWHALHANGGFDRLRRCNFRCWP